MIVNYQGSRDEKKALRAEKVNSIVVTVMRGETVLLFDGDEESQKRLDRFARAMRANGETEIPWVMADNEVVMVTADELEEALYAAMRRQGELWFL